MVFNEEVGERYDKLLHFYKYHPWKIAGQRNPAFDEHSGLILDLKDDKPKGVDHFCELLSNKLGKGVTIAVVPSHDHTKTTGGVKSLVAKLAKAGHIDASSCLVRTYTIDKLATGGDRSIENHLKSIVVKNEGLIEGRDVLLLDDVTTSGNSLKACKQLLIAAGSGRVQMLAFGKTV